MAKGEHLRRAVASPTVSGTGLIGSEGSRAPGLALHEGDTTTDDSGARTAIPAASPVWPPLLRRTDASRYLAIVHGVQRAPSTLAKASHLGTGPRYQLLGRVPLYAPVELDRWVRESLGPLQSSTSAVHLHPAALPKAKTDE
jgi:hypothetical protein